MPSVTLFGVGSPIVVDVEESCRRAGWRIDPGAQCAGAGLCVGLRTGAAGHG